MKVSKIQEALDKNHRLVVMINEMRSVLNRGIIEEGPDCVYCPYRHRTSPQIRDFIMKQLAAEIKNIEAERDALEVG